VFFLDIIEEELKGIFSFFDLDEIQEGVRWVEVISIK
jgi:hypothetical protein